MELPFLGFGVGLRPSHYQIISDERPRIDWFEVISENYMIPGGLPLYWLDKIRESYPIVLHGVSLSIGSSDPLSQTHLKELKKLVKRVNPPWVSDHLCWTGIGGKNSHDLLPLPYTEETLSHVIKRARKVQDILEKPLLLENVSSYLEYNHSTFTEWDFLREVALGADCGILLDINNIYVNSQNHGFNPLDYINAIPQDRVGQFHLAGHREEKGYLLDTHDHPVKEAVWALYEKALLRFGSISTLLEWDDQIPPLSTLMDEIKKAKHIHEHLRLKLPSHAA